MVSKAELLAKQVTTARKQLKEARTKTQQQLKTIQKPLSQQLLRTVSREQKLKIEGQRRVAERAVKLQQKSLATQEKEIVEVEKVVRVEQQRQKDIKIGKDAADAFAKGATFAALDLSDFQRDVFRSVVQERAGFTERTEAALIAGKGNLKEGLKIIKKREKEFIKLATQLGEGVFAKGVAIQQKLRKELGKLDLEKLTDTEITRFEEAGLIKFEQGKSFEVPKGSFDVQIIKAKIDLPKVPKITVEKFITPSIAEPIKGLPPILAEIEEKFPTIETVKGKAIAPPGLVVIKETIEPAFGQATTIVDIKVRQPTLDESLKSLPKKEVDKFKLDLDKTRLQLQTGKISEPEAQAKIDKQIDDFTKAQIIRGIPQNLALGGAVGLASALFPPAGLVLGGLFTTGLFLQRRAIAQQFRKFPKQSALQLSSFIAGGLAGSKIGAKFKPVVINPKTFKSSSLISGTEKSKFIKRIEELDSGFLNLVSRGKVTDTVVFDIRLKDGRIFRILEFSKTRADPLAPKDLISERSFLGSEITKLSPEIIVGATIGRLQRKAGVGEAFTQVIKFTPQKSAFTQTPTGIIKAAKQFEIGTKFQVFPKGPDTTGIFSTSKIIRIKNANAKLIQKIRFLESKNIADIKIAEIKSLVNLKREISGFRPFTDAEFAKGIGETISVQLINTALKDAKIVLGKSQKIASEALTLKKEIIGQAETLAKPPKPGPVPPKTPFEVTFADPKTQGTANKAFSALSKKFTALKSKLKTDRDKGIPVSTKTKQEFVQISKQFQGLQEQFPASVGPLTLALGAEIKSNPFIKLSVPTIGFIQGLNSAQRFLVGNDSLLISRITQNSKLLSKIKQKLAQQSKLEQKSTTLTSQRNVQKLSQTLRQLQKQSLSLKQIQRLNQQLRTAGLSRQNLNSTVRAPKTRIKPPVTFFPPTDEDQKLRLFGKEAKNQGYFAWAKEKGIRKRLNLVPISQKSAKDLSSFISDHSTSRTFGITKAINLKIKKPKTKIPKNYFDRTKRKYRDFRIVQGKKILLDNQFIEKTKFAIDTRGEKEGLSVARALALRRKPIVTKKPKFGTKVTLKAPKL